MLKEVHSWGACPAENLITHDQMKAIREERKAEREANKAERKAQKEAENATGGRRLMEEGNDVQEEK